MTDRQNVILCVDDEEKILKTLQRSLRTEGYKVLTALNGPQALNLLREERVDLIISDQRMPDMTGAELLSIVRKKYPNVISIVLSGYTDFDALVKSVNEGEIFRFLYKPWDDKELKSIVSLALKHRRFICTNQQ